MLTSFILFAAEAGANASANVSAQGLAREQFWGVMIAVFIFVGFSLFLITSFLRGQQTSITRLFEKSIDANAKLSEAIDKLGDETRESNQKLRDYLDSNLDKIAEAIRDIGNELENHHKRLNALEQEHEHITVGDNT